MMWLSRNFKVLDSFSPSKIEGFCLFYVITLLSYSVFGFTDNHP